MAQSHTSTDPARERRWDVASFILFALIGAVILFTYKSYGITCDEHLGSIIGRNILHFYTDNSSAAQHETKGNLHLYGGLFETICSVPDVLIKGQACTVDHRHLANALFGLVGIVGCWCLGRFMGGAAVGFFSAVFLVLIPSYYGQMFMNSKDIPFAAAYVWSVYAMVRCAEARRIGPGMALLTGVAIGAALAIRSGALMLFGFLCLILAYRVWSAWIAGPVTSHGSPEADTADAKAETAAFERPPLPPRVPSAFNHAAREVMALVMPTLIIVGIAWLIMLLFWPWAWKYPFTAPFIAQSRFSHYGETDQAFFLPFMGKMVQAQHLPRSYVPVFLAIKLPELFLPALLALPVLLLLRYRAACAHERRVRILPTVFVALTWLVPLAIVLVIRPVLYNEIRHFDFFYPVLSCLAALAAVLAVQRIGEWRRAAAVSLVAIALAWGVYHVSVMVRLHPYEYIYFNALTGGPRGAAKRFETLDYWGSSAREAVLWLQKYTDAAQADGRTGRQQYTVSCGWLWWCAKEYFPQNFVMLRNLKRKDVNYAIVLGYECRPDNSPGREIYRVQRMKVPLAIVKEVCPPQAATQ